jgi:hypothetical protein
VGDQVRELGPAGRQRHAALTGAGRREDFADIGCGWLPGRIRKYLIGQRVGRNLIKCGPADAEVG